MDLGSIWGLTVRPSQTLLMDKVNGSLAASSFSVRIGLPFPAPAKQAQHAETGGEEWEGGGKRRCSHG